MSTNNSNNQPPNDKDDKDPTTTTTTCSTFSSITQSFPPSHILADGRFVYLPPPTLAEQSRFFERAIAKYKLLESDVQLTSEQQEQVDKDKQENETDANKQEEAPKVHPLALASARIQGSGVNELNRAINLSTLVNTGEYFGLSNVVDPSLELNLAAAAKDEQAAAAAAAAATKTEGATDSTTEKDGGSTAPAGTAAPTAPAPTAATTSSAAAPPSTQQMQEEQRVKSAYVLKRKRAVFEQASRVLQRHCHRLQAACQAQTIPDLRLRQLRPQWRLVAPEHGTRAKPHAVRPTEVVAIDVDVYGNNTSDNSNAASNSSSSLVGRLASQVPRYATVELTEGYFGQQQQQKGGAKEDDTTTIKTEPESKEETVSDPMDVDGEAKDKSDKNKDETPSLKDADTKGTVTNNDHDDSNVSRWTIAEPFAIADPTLGNTDFDPNKVTYLTLQFDIEKPSTGFCMSACLEPMATMSAEKAKEEAKNKQQQSQADQNDNNNDKKEKSSVKNDNENEEDHHHTQDEKVLVALQHSLFCAKLFEAIRKELMGETDGTEDSQSQGQQHVVWLASESEENFLPPPSDMVQPTMGGGTALCAIHCHASEVKVQLDSEYTLRAKLVEADKEPETPRNSNLSTTSNNSGSQSPERLLILCRSLLLHAQEAYHNFSLQDSLEMARKQREEEEQRLALGDAPRGLDRIQKKNVRKQPRILQSVVGLGTKMLFEQRIRKALVRVRHWLKSVQPNNEESLKTEWLSLSLFDMHAHFCLTYGTVLSIDVTLVRDEMTVITYDDAESGGTSAGYRKVTFHSDAEFEIYLKLQLRRILRQQQRQKEQQPQQGPTQ